jgi:hypothetical protein
MRCSVWFVILMAPLVDASAGQFRNAAHYVLQHLHHSY